MKPLNFTASYDWAMLLVKEVRDGGFSFSDSCLLNDGVWSAPTPLQLTEAALEVLEDE